MSLELVKNFKIENKVLKGNYYIKNLISMGLMFLKLSIRKILILTQIFFQNHQHFKSYELFLFNCPKFFVQNQFTLWFINIFVA